MTTEKTILIVEDEQAMVGVLKDKLGLEGFLVLTASDGEEGLKVALEHQPDLILLDIVMPVMDGMAMLKKLREDAWGKTVPVIILTNLDTNDKILEGVTHDQPSYYFIKSDIKIEDAIQKVKEILSTP